MSKKLKLEDLNVQSFVTSFSEGKKHTVKGGIPGGTTVTVKLDQCQSVIPNKGGTACEPTEGTCNFTCLEDCTQGYNDTRHRCNNETNNFHCA